MHLTKHHGLGNDFLVALRSEVPREGGALARSWCHRTTGVGADGLIFGTPSSEADVEMTLFNSDGSQAEISGNGIRCLAQAYFERCDRAGEELAILAAGQVRQLRRINGDGQVDEIAVEMGAVATGPVLPDMEAMTFGDVAPLRVETGDIGNPHVVLELEDLGVVNAVEDGRALEQLWAPAGINVHFMRHSGVDEITLLHWERGAGATSACGSGATVAAVIANGWGLVGDEVTVRMPGGESRVLVGDAATLIGPAVLVARIEVDHG